MAVHKDTQRLYALLDLLNTIGVNLIQKKDVYNYLMGDTHALDKYQGDPEVY